MGGFGREQAVPLWSAARRADEEAGRIEHGDDLRKALRWVQFLRVGERLLQTVFRPRRGNGAGVHVVHAVAIRPRLFPFCQDASGESHRHRDHVLGRKEKIPCAEGRAAPRPRARRAARGSSGQRNSRQWAGGWSDGGGISGERTARIAEETKPPVIDAAVARSWRARRGGRHRNGQRAESDGST